MSSSRLTRALIGSGNLDKLREFVRLHPECLAASNSAPLLSYAAGTGRMDTLQFLIAAGLTPKAAEDAQCPPLVDAVEFPEIVDFLLSRGASASARGVMVAAAADGSLSTVERLLRAGGNIHEVVGNPPRTPYEQAARMGRWDVAALLRPEARSFDPAAWRDTIFGPSTPFTLVAVPPAAPFRLATSARNGHTILSTSGLCIRTLPGVPIRAEVCMFLPDGWPAGPALGDDPLWPARWLISAALASLGDPVLKPLDVVGNGDGRELIDSGAPYVGSLTVPAFREPELADDDGNPLGALALVPVLADEFAAIKNGDIEVMNRVVDLWEEEGFVVRRSRPSVAF